MEFPSIQGRIQRVITAIFRVCKWVGGGYRGVQGHRGGWNSRLSQAFIETLQPGVDTGVLMMADAGLCKWEGVGYRLVQVGRGDAGVWASGWGEY